MSQVIRIPESIYSRLEKHAVGFDNPINVIEKLLNYYEGIDQDDTDTTSSRLDRRKRDTTKYAFNNKHYGKGRLVLAVVEKFVADNSSINFEKLTSHFPKNIQGSIGVFNTLDFVTEKYNSKSHKRHFIKTDEILTISDCKIVVCTEWGISNIQEFIKRAETLGYFIEPISA